MTTPHHRSVWAPLAALLLLTLLLTWPTAATLTTHIVDRQDPLLNTWIMAWEAHQLLQDPLDLYRANIFYPYDAPLAFSEILISTTALVLPLHWAGISPLTAYNIAFLLSFFLTGLGMYLWAGALLGRREAALLAAVAFAFSPYRFGHLSQIQLLAFGWLPLTLLYLDRLLAGRGQWQQNATLLGLFFGLQALASFYAAVFAAGACGLYGVGWLLVYRRLRREALLAGVAAALGVGIVMAPFVWPYFQVQAALGAGWTLAENERFSASLQAYFYAPEQTVWGPLTARFGYIYGPCCPPDTLFPGVTLLVLAGVALLRGRGGRRWVLALIMGGAFLLSLGPRLTVWAGEPTNIPLLYGWLFAYIPGFQALRAPVRWAAVVSLALSLLAGWGLVTLQGWVPSPGSQNSQRGRNSTTSARVLAGVALGLVVLEFAALPLRMVQPPEASAVVTWLAQQAPTRIVELPLAAALPTPEVSPLAPRQAWEVSRLLEHQYFSTRHWHETPDGYSGYIPPRHGEFAQEMEGFPSLRSITLLQRLGITLVVLHTDERPPGRWHLLHQPQGAFPGLEQVASFPDAEVWQVRPVAASAPPPCLMPPPQLLTTGPLVAGGPVAVWWTTQVEGLKAIPADCSFGITLAWADAQGRPLGDMRWARVTLPLVVDEVALVPLDGVAASVGLGTPTTPGAYRLLVAAEDGAWAREVGVTVVAEQGGPLPVPLAVRLVRAEMPPTVGTGEALPVTLTWEARQALPAYYSLSLRLVGPDGQVVDQEDGAPGGALGTFAWIPGVGAGHPWPLAVPEDAAPGLYQVQLLWYDPETGQPAWLWDGAGWQADLVVGQVVVAERGG